ncbi:MAG: DUF4136 domain-containing protein [Enhygromyxa sp.]
MRAIPSLCLLLVLLGGCRDESTPRPGPELDVEVQHSPDLELDGYKTFEVIPPTTMVDEAPPTNFVELERHIVAAMTEQLIDKGLTHDAERPQLLINPLVTIGDLGESLDFYDAHFGWYWGYTYPWAQSGQLPRGSLVIDVVDQSGPATPHDDKLVYRGVVRGLLSEDPESVQLALDDAARMIFAAWPALRDDEATPPRP